MPINTLLFEGRLGPDAARAGPADGEVRMTVSGDTFAGSRVSVQLSGKPFLDTTQPLFHSFCDHARGKPARAWDAVVIERDMTDLKLWMPVRISTVEQNLLKACFLVYLWIEPFFVGQPTRPHGDILLDEFIVDYTGTVGVQSFLYFPPAEYQQPADDASIIRLYELQLVCRLRAEIAGQSVDRWFTPLVIPGVLVDRFGATSEERREHYQAWLGIKSRLQAAVEHISRRRG